MTDARAAAAGRSRKDSAVDISQDDGRQDRRQVGEGEANIRGDKSRRLVTMEHTAMAADAAQQELDRN